MKHSAIFLFLTLNALLCFGQVEHFRCGDIQPSSKKINSVLLNQDHPEQIIYADRFGNIQDPIKIEQARSRAAKKSLLNTCTTTNNLFKIEFLDDTGFGFDDAQYGSDRRDVICQVFEDVSRMISSPHFNQPCFSAVKVMVDLSLDFPLSQNNVLAAGSAYYGYNLSSSGIVHGEAWKVINSGENKLPFGTPYHGYLQYNFHESIEWHTDLTTIPSSSPPPPPALSKADLYATTLHEVFHMLGFASSIDDPSGAGTNGYYFPWDNLIKDAQGNKLINGSCYSHQYSGVSLTSGCSSLFVNDGMTDHVVHAPTTFTDGRSLGHLDNCASQNANYLMHPFQNATAPVRVPTEEEVLLLCELGYETTGLYGDQTLSFHRAYDANWDCGNIVAGVSDGFNPLGSASCVNHITVTCDPHDFDKIDFILNDYGASDMTCIEVITGSASISNITPSSFTFTPSQPGIFVLSYIPVNSSGQQGNAVDIYITVPTCPGYDYNCVNTDPCNIICNSDINDNIIACDYNGSNSCGPTITGSISLDNACSGFSGWIPAPTLYNSPDFLYPCFNGAGGNRFPAQLDNTSGYFHFFAGLIGGYHQPETVATPVNVLANQKYLLSYYRAGWSIDPLHPLEFFNVELVDGNDMIGNISNTEVIIQETDIDFAWEKTVVCFTPSTDKEFLIFNASKDTSITQSGFVDNVELIEDTFTAGSDISIDCGQQVTLGSTHCEISDTDYQWYTVVQSVPVIINGETASTLTASPSVTTTYRLIRTISGSHGNCLTSEDDVTVTVPCVPPTDINIKVFLEGAMLSNTLMSTELFNKNLLPGMLSTGGQTITPAGQPYNIEPWKYFGFEGATFTNIDYTSDDVDWVLLSIRTGESETTQVAMTAGLLMNDGNVKLINDITLPNPTAAYHIVVQHRNHLPVMSHLVPINNGTLSFDFTTQDSYNIGGAGQKQISNNGPWMMFAGNIHQYDELQDFEQKDINGTDKIFWSYKNGEFLKYQAADVNLNGDINGDDKIIWSYNNGTFSAVPVAY